MSNPNAVLHKKWASGILYRGLILLIITPILKSLVVPVIWLALIGVFHSQIAPFFALNRIFFPANEEATLKTKQPARFQGLLKVTNQITGKWKTKSIMCNFCFQNSYFFPPKNRWIQFQTSLVLHQYNTWTDQVLYLSDFQNGCNKVVIEPYVT